MTGADTVYFLHIPKTGGTSTHDFLTRAVGTDRATPQLLWDDLIRGSGAIDETTKVITGHFAGLLPLWLGYWPLIITIVRDPIQRALSHINHVQREPSHPMYDRARDRGIRSYCSDPVLRTTIENFQARYLASLSFSRVLLRPSDSERPPNGISVAFESSLCSLDTSLGLERAAIEALAEIDAVGLTEHLEASMALFAKVLGWDTQPEVGQLNRADAQQQRVSDLDQRDLEVLAEATAIDQVVYEQATRQFRNQCAEFEIATTS